MSRLTAIPVLLLLVLLAPPVAAAPTAPGPPIRIVVLGDSVASGLHCDCQPFPGQYRTILGQGSGRGAVVANYGVSGFDSGNVLRQIRTDDAVRVQVAQADIVVVEIGANDFMDKWGPISNGECRLGNNHCFPETMTQLQNRLTAALTTINELRAGQPTQVLVTGYWNVFADGRVAFREEGAGFVRRSRNLTAQVNVALFSAALATGGRYVDLGTAFFRGGRARLTRLLTDDGDHPSWSGHRLVAQALARHTSY